MNVTFTVPHGTAGRPSDRPGPCGDLPHNSYTSGIGDWSSDVLAVLSYSYTLG